MKKIKNMMKKGGIADIITIMVIVGLVIALIIAVVMPMITSTEGTASQNSKQMKNTNSMILNVGQATDEGAPIY